jgi:hypothetical protein
MDGFTVACTAIARLSLKDETWQARWGKHLGHGNCDRQSDD